GVHEQPRRSLLDVLTQTLQDRELLLVLDNCEHVLDACAELVEHLLCMCPGIRVLTTSRAALGVSGEAVWRVPPLSLPPVASVTVDADCLNSFEAVQLFQERARLIDASFQITAMNA